jgi:Zn-dependent peptidase ImmA (M78 family)
VAGAVTDPRAGVVRQRYQALFADPELPVPVHEIAEDLLGLRVVDDGELGAVSGALYPAAREIVLNAAEGESRRRFTLAHELGHWICHCAAGRDQPVFCRERDLSQASDRALEREANVFAAELLMPERELRAAFARAADVRELAEVFAVSPLAMQWRLYSFGLIDAPSV